MGVSGSVAPAGRRGAGLGPGAGPPEPATRHKRIPRRPQTRVAKRQGCRLRQDGPLPPRTGIEWAGGCCVMAAKQEAVYGSLPTRSFPL